MNSTPSILCGIALYAHEIGTTRVSVLLHEGRTYDVEIVTDAAALVDLDDQQTTNVSLGAACHQLTHVVGRTAGQLQGAVAFTQGSDVCASGYYHGVTEALMMAIGPSAVVDRAQRIGAAFSPTSADR